MYGAGDPLLIVHFNGGSIADVGAQIDHFRKGYKVIAMDSRDRGNSGDSPGKVTYEKMTDDLAALLDHLKTGPVDVLGWSDGGIEALLLGIRHPAKVKKIVAMAANLNPSDKAVRPEVLDLIRQSMAAVPAADRDTPRGQRELKVTGMMLEEPNIEAKALEAITAPTLVLASDHDTIVDQHTVEIYQHIPNGQLAIFPNATHMIPFDDPATFNGTVERFLRTSECEWTCVWTPRPLRPCRSDDERRASSLMQRLRSHGVTEKPQIGIRPAEQVDLVGAEIETSLKQLGHRGYPVHRKSDPQLLFREQRVDDHSNAHL